eukprot:CAMPEP_0171079556 /NCGR_PEP_ID=MMETSP0766_2-20121228/15327_1 /TAXON_ID=439317 /ORGANISM="Gambierdiscus australes, Strain CAWD 149" /LENGTH=280 /DNA_ID=CAMNT_0011536751 /DNA_START=118 /DNA_END=958 /DNA_ORIENTATION=-
MTANVAQLLEKLRAFLQLHVDHRQGQVCVLMLDLEMSLVDELTLFHLAHRADDAEANETHKRNHQGHAKGDDDGVQHHRDRRADDPLVLVFRGDVGKKEGDEEGAEAQVRKSDHPDQRVLRAPGPQLPVPLWTASVRKRLDAPRAQRAQHDCWEARYQNGAQTNSPQPANLLGWVPLFTVVGQASVAQARSAVHAARRLKEDRGQHEGSKDVNHEEDHTHFRAEEYAARHARSKGVLPKEEPPHAAGQQSPPSRVQQVLLKVLPHCLMKVPQELLALDKR